MDFNVLSTLYSILYLINGFISASSSGDCKFLYFGDDMYSNDIVICEEFDSINTFKLKFQNFSNGIIFSQFILNNSDLAYLPASMFNNTNVKTIQIDNSVINGLEIRNEETPFSGLENRLSSFIVKNVEGVNNWNWAALENLSELRILFISYTNLRFWPQNFSRIPTQLTNILLYGNNFSCIEDNVFSHFPELVSLGLGNNGITTVKRSMFPPVSELLVLSLMQNKIKHLPADIFSNMTKLRLLVLSSNYLYTLDPDVFSTVIMSLVEIYVTDNEIICCKSLEWLVNNENKNKIFGQCKGPARLYGRELKSLEEDELAPCDY